MLSGAEVAQLGEHSTQQHTSLRVKLKTELSLVQVRPSAPFTLFGISLRQKRHLRFLNILAP